EVYGGGGFPGWGRGIDAQQERAPASGLRGRKWGLHYYDTARAKDDVLVRETPQAFLRYKLTNIKTKMRVFAVRTQLVKAVGQTAKFFQARNGGSGHPGILGYEPFNEPHPVGQGKLDFEQRVLPQYYGEALNEIRKADSKAFLFVQPRVDWTTYDPGEPEFQAAAFTLHPGTFLGAGLLSGERTVFSFHYYDPWTLSAATPSALPPNFAHGDNMHNKQKEWPEVFRLMREA